MTNEFIFLLLSIVDIFFVFIAARLGKSWLFATIAVNLILVSTFGAKLINIFGFTTNAGNAFYACVFLATHMLIEYFGKKEGLKTIPVGILSIFIFISMSQLTVLLRGLDSSSSINAAMNVLFQSTPRIAIASMIAYICAQFINVYIYDYLRGQTGQSFLWIRDNFSNLLGQLLDSILFFSIAFLGILPTDILIQTIFTGFLVKVIVGMLGTPFLYLSKFRKKEVISTENAHKT